MHSEHGLPDHPDSPDGSAAPRTDSVLRSVAELYLFEAVPGLRRMKEEGKTEFGIDARTGVPDKKFVLSRRALAEIDKAFPGPKKFRLLDFAHMNAPNKFGLGPAVDALMQRVGELNREHVIPKYGVMIRLGGDEFGFITADTPEADAEMSLFEHEIRMESERLLNAPVVDPRLAKTQGKEGDEFHPERFGRAVEEARAYALFRQTMRSVRSEYLRECEMAMTKPSENDFREWLSRQEEDVYLWDRATEWMLDEVTTKRLHRQPDRKVRLCEPDFECVDLGDEPLTPELIARAIGGAEEALHANKIRPHDAPEAEASLASQLGENQRLEIEEHARHEATFGETSAELRRLRAELERHPERAADLNVRMMALDFHLKALNAVDPNSGVPGRESFKYRSWPADEKSVTFLSVELNYFGAVNNTLGYSVGNQCLLRAASALRSSVSDAVHIARGRGGSFILAVPGSQDRNLDAALAAASAVVRSEVLRGHEGEELLKLEAAERRALDRRRGLDTGSPVGELLIMKEREVERAQLEGSDPTLFDALVQSRL